MMKFYTYFPSSASFRLRIALNWKGIVSSSHIHVPVSLAKKEHHQQAYADKNPSRLVPALELDDGIVLTQSLSMIEYLEETHPELFAQHIQTGAHPSVYRPRSVSREPSVTCTVLLL